MSKIIKRLMCITLLVMVIFHDVGYSVWAKEIDSEKKLENGMKKFEKKNYTKEERNKIMKEAMKKIKGGEELTDEDKAVINWEYEELEITLPEEEIEWEVDHEKGIGVNEGIMTLSTVVTSSLIKGSKTTVDVVGKISTKRYSDGKGSDYLFYDRVMSSFVIPGIKQTTVGNSTCDDMATQGICCYNGYIFLTAYCAAGEHDAVIYVLDVSTKKYITTLLTGEAIHAGGITYANGYLWVGNVSSKDTGYLYYYNFSQIKEAIGYVLNDSAITAVDISGYDGGCVSLLANNKASYVTTYNGYLCVGEYMQNQNDVGELNLYNPSVLMNGIVNKMTIATVPENANGALFYTTYNNTYLIINTNYGKYKESIIYVYSLNNNSLSPILTHKKTMGMPCMVEEAFNYGGITYFVYESAAKEYRNALGMESTMGYVCGLSTNFIYK